jgi:hypothetical protein
MQAQEIDSVAYNKWMNDVVVTAKIPLYQTKADVMIYNVACDSSLVNKDSYEALKYAPLIIAERNGTVRAMGDQSSITYNRYYQADFQVSVSWRFGKLRAEERATDKVIEHNDIKQSYGE